MLTVYIIKRDGARLFNTLLVKRKRCRRNFQHEILFILLFDSKTDYDVKPTMLYTYILVHVIVIYLLFNFTGH